MKTHRSFLTLTVSLLLSLLAMGLAQAQGQTGNTDPAGTAARQPVDTTGVLAPLSTAFTYQGQLIQNGSPVNGTCDLRFTLWDAASGGSQISWGWLLEAVEIVDGLFTARLDFGGVHDGSARWLEVAVRCPAGSGDYATLDPRQELTAAPAALALKLPYAAQANIGGPLVTFHNTGDGEAALFQSDQGYALWVESALLDGLHIASAGTSGVSVTAAATGLSVGMVTVDGVNIGNVGASGLRVNWSGSHAVHVVTSLTDGVHVDSAGYDGFYVGSAGRDGLSIAAAADDGVQVQSAGGDGMYVGTATGSGLAVYNAGADGVYVGAAGIPSDSTPSSGHSGFEVAGAQDYGLWVGRADSIGVRVNSAGTGFLVNAADYDGLYMNTVGERGLHIREAGVNGVYVDRAGNPSTTTPSNLTAGFEVAGAENYGLYVGRADQTGVAVSSAHYGIAVGWADLDGVNIESAGDDGVYVDTVFGDGLDVLSAGANGVRVSSAGADGIYVSRAGTPSVSQSSYSSNGFEVAGAQGHGVYVGRADDTGVYVVSAGWNGIVVDVAGGDGVRAGSAAYNAFYGNTTNANGEWGLYTPDKVYAQNVTLQTLTLIAQVSGPDALAPGDVVAADGVGAVLEGSAAPLPLVRLAGSGANGVIGVVEGRMALTPVPQVRDEGAGERLELRGAEGPARAGDFVALTVLGLARVKVDAAPAPIRPGTRLTGAADGRARALKTVVVEGVTLAESAATLGIALAAPDADGLAWVLVNPQ